MAGEAGLQPKIKAVGVIGLGFMGGAIAANIVRAGFNVTGFDSDSERVNLLAAKGVKAASSCREVALRSELVLTSLPSPTALQEVLHGEHGVIASGHKGLILMECSTLALEDKQTVQRQLETAGMILLDCPISGGTRAAEKDLVVYGSGPGEVYERCLPVIESFARGNYDLGEFGNGTRMKMLANLLVAIHIVSSAEALVLGMKAGLDPKQILTVLNDSSGRSRMLEIRGPRMVRNDYDNPGMRVQLFQKDIKIIGEFAAQLGCPTPLFASSAQVYLSAMALGLENKDTAAVCAVLEQWAHLEREQSA